MKTKKTKTITTSIIIAIIIIAATVLYLNKKQDTTEENTNYLEISNIEDIKNKTKEIKDDKEKTASKYTYVKKYKLNKKKQARGNRRNIHILKRITRRRKHIQNRI